VLGLRCDRDEAEIIYEQNHTRTAGFAGGRGSSEQNRLAHCIGDVWTQPRDQRRLRLREPELVILTMQAQVSPALIADDQGGAKLISQTQLAHDVAIAQAGRAIVVGRSIE